MIKQLKAFYKKYREVIHYLFFGGLTTLVNILVFYIFDTGLTWPYLLANALAIALSILFAYITNKIFVFESKTEGWRQTCSEFFRFISFRLVSGLFDMLTMWILVDLFTVNTNSAKLLTQFVVVVLNYLFSKFFIFL